MEPKCCQMNQKITLSLGLTFAVVATLAIAPIVSEMAYAASSSTGSGGSSTPGASGANGVNGGSHVTGPDRACENSGAQSKL